MTTWAILVAAGEGRRLGKELPKALVDLDDRPLFLHPLSALAVLCDGIVVVGPEKHLDTVREALPLSIPKGREACEIRSIAGGPNRQMSVKAGLSLIPQNATRILVHDAARPFIEDGLIEKLLKELSSSDAVIPGVLITDTVKRVQGDRVVKTESRDGLATVETPQAFKADVLRAAHAIAKDSATDDAALVEAAGGKVRFVELAQRGLKVTRPGDLEIARDKLSSREASTFGTGDDVHALVPGRPCWLGCIEIPHDRGPDGHSDGDPVAHAICDALLGAAGLGDIGSHFPSDDDRWKGASGKELLAETARFLQLSGFEIGNIDATILIQEPTIAPHRVAMQHAIADALGIDPLKISIKATTTDRLGIIGRGDAVASHAVVGLRPITS